MKILFDYQIFQLQTHGGISRGIMQIIKGLNAAGYECEVALKESDNIYIKEDFGTHIPLVYRPLSYFVEKIKCAKKKKDKLYSILRLIQGRERISTINEKYSIKKIVEGDYDIFQPTYFSSYFIPYIKKPFVYIIHDMIPERFPEQYPLDNKQSVFKRKYSDLASAIITPSQNTKDDVVKLLDIPEKKVHVIHWCYEPIDHTWLIKQQAIYEFPYILFVGRRSGYKGFGVLLEQIAEIVKIYPNIHLVCTGTPFNNEEKIKINELQLSNNVLQRFVSDKELKVLYRDARCFVFPSLYEGFGIPILEAFSCGCPVFLNHASCFPEIAADAAIYFEQDESVSNFADCFFSYMKNEENNRSEYICKGKKRLDCFSEKRMIEDYINLYKNVYRESY